MSICKTDSECNEDIDFFFEIIGYSLRSHGMQVDYTRVDRSFRTAEYLCVSVCLVFSTERTCYRLC